MNLTARHRHLRDFDGWRCDSAAHFEIVAHHFDVFHHLLEIARDGDLFDRIAQFAVFDPDAGGAAGIVSGDEVDAETTEFGYVKPSPYRRDDLFGSPSSRRE